MGKNDGERTFGLDTIGKEARVIETYVKVTPPNYVTPNNTSWDLKATLESESPQGGHWETGVVKTTAVAAQKLNVKKNALQESTWIGDTVYWEIATEIDNDKYGDLGIYRPSTITYTDVLPVGFDPVAMRYEGKPFTDYTFDKATRKLTWTLDGLHEEERRSHAVPKFEIHTKVLPTACEGDPAPCTKESKNTVEALSTYSNNDTLDSSAQATVTMAGRKSGELGTISKTSQGLHINGGDETRKGIFRRSYKHAKDSDWDRRELRQSTEESRAAGDPLSDEKRSLVAGAYTVDVAVMQGGRPVKDGSNLLPLTQSYEDDVPCMDQGFVEEGFLFKSRTDGKLCQEPAFHVTAVEISRASDGSLDVGDFAPVAVLNDKREVRLTKLGEVKAEEDGKEVTQAVVYSVPADARGKVSRIVAAPGRPLKGVKTWKMTIGGFAEDSLPGDAILRNENARVKVWAKGQTEPFGEGTSPLAELHVLGSLHNVLKNNPVALDILHPVEGLGDETKTGVLWNLEFSYRGKQKESGYIVVSDLLPRGMELVTDPDQRLRDGGEFEDAVVKYKIAHFDRGVKGEREREVQTTVVENYRDGRTLVQWKIPHEWAVEEDGQVDLVGRFKFITRPLYFGNFPNDAYANDATEPNLRCAGENVEDSFDIDRDRRTKQACHTAAYWFNVPPEDSRALTLAKAVKGPNDESFAYTPKKALVPAEGGDVTYRVEALNSSGKPMTEVVAYDVLPYEGDTGVSSDLSGENRGSTQSAKFTQMTEVPEGVTVYYSTSVNPCRPEVFEAHKGNKGCDNNWSSTVPKDPGSVKALKFVYKGELNPRETLTVEFAMSVPAMKATTDVVWNSVAAKASFAEGAPLPAIEAPKVGAARVVEPQFAVEKKPGKATVGDGKWSSSYTVTVKNTSPFEGTSSRVTDTPKLPKGFKFNKVLVDGAEVNFKNGSFPVTAGEKLAAGKSKSFKVVVSGTYTASEVDWAAAAKCEPGDGGASGGLVNTVAMADDSDGPDNNSACNPVPAKFSVKKEAVGKATAKNGTWSSTYKVTVKNTGDVKGVSKPVKDTPSVPAGFTVTSAKVDKGEPVELTDGSFTVTEGVELDPGKEKEFTVVISGSFDPAKVVESEVSECASAGAAEGAHGFVNKVTMGGDTDGAKNNTACTTVEG
ncbi:DUF11 domain-containing protein, partial [Dermabacter sp. p3-SID358]|uniref:DUF11 domain-containing protein n=1 Tax=Dermabacter sp. p3-SID358 TaxID=2916114 RepID=UPI0021A64253